MLDAKFGCLPTMIGSMPHTDPAEACALTERFLKDIHSWPQLPKRSFLENMYAQYSEGFPGAVIENNSLFIDRTLDSSVALERLYTAYLNNDFKAYPIRQEYAAGLHAFLKTEHTVAQAVKGQITGPISWGLTVTDKDKKSIIYDDVLGDAAAKLLRLKASWQERALSKLSNRTIIFLDEPYMTSFGSAYVSLSRERVISLLEEVLGGISGLKGVHCCGNTDWSVLLATSVNILNFDAYNFAESLTLYPKEVKQFLANGNAIAWGIVPTDSENLVRETVSSLKDRLEEAIAPFTRHGIPFKTLVEQALLTPSCGLASLEKNEAAAHALELLAGLSDTMRKKYL